MHIPYMMNLNDSHRHIVAVTEIIVLLALRNCIHLYASRFVKVPQHTSILSGQT
jgi:hypothetical protein